LSAFKQKPAIGIQKVVTRIIPTEAIHMRGLNTPGEFFGSC
jgi:hypothetical protein